MIALTVPKHAASDISVEDGEHYEDMHITLAYIGKLSDVGQEAVDAAREIAQLMASNNDALSGLLAGVGRFSSSDSSDGKDVFYANVDIPELTSFRDELVHVLKIANIPLSLKHGYTPHVTIKYLAQDEDTPYQRLNPISVHFPSLAFCLGDEWVEFPFRNTDPDDMERFDRNPCGDSEGGFEKNNTCASGGTGSSPGNNKSRIVKVRINDPKRKNTRKYYFSRFKKIAEQNGFKATFEPYTAGDIPGLVANYEPETDEIKFNTNNTKYDDMEGNQKTRYDSGFQSTEHPDHTLFHEMAHGFHARKIGKDKIYDIQRKGSIYGPDLVKATREEVSSLGLTNGLEFVAEVYAGIKLGGEEYSDIIMDEYRRLGGPDPDDDGIELFSRDWATDQEIADEIERFANGNCGIGPDGFELGNTCAKGGGGSKAVIATARRVGGSAPVSPSSSQAPGDVPYRPATARRPAQGTPPAKTAPTTQDAPAQSSKPATPTTKVDTTPSLAQEKALEQKRKELISKYAKVAAKAGFRVIEDGSRIFDKFPDKSGAIASFAPKYNAIIFNEKSKYYDDPKKMMDRCSKSGWFSSDSTAHVVIHEIAHGLHFRSVGESRFNQLRSEAIPANLKPIIAKEVSAYATTNPLETIAEMFTAMKANGKKYSNELMMYYHACGGPK